jgi:hypothetical protein
MNQAMADLKVSDLLVPNSKQWHTENIYLLFDNVSAQHICRTPLYASVQQDIPTWKLEKNGIYSVRSAYRNIMDRSNIVQQHGIAERWNQVWRCKLPPRIKNFVWRVARGCLPSRVRLQTRGVNCTTQCPFCDGQEDNLHALFLCPKSIQCWQKLELWNDISTVTSNPGNISSILFEIIHRLHNSKHSLFGTLMWSIWKNQNNKVWNDSAESCQAICDRATSFLASWEHAQELKQAPLDSRRNTHVSWTKPSPGRYKCNVDAAFFEDIDTLGIGICIRDAGGAFVLARSEYFSPLIDIHIGEAMAVKSHGMGTGSSTC